MLRIMLPLCLVLAGCAFDPIVDVITPTSISVKHCCVGGTAAKATVVAEDHCASYGKAATLMTQSKDSERSDWTTLIFHCVKQ